MASIVYGCKCGTDICWACIVAKIAAVAEGKDPQNVKREVVEKPSVQEKPKEQVVEEKKKLKEKKLCLLTSTGAAD